MTGIIQAWYIGGVGSIILTVVQRNSICTCIVYCYQNEQENGEAQIIPVLLTFTEKHEEKAIDPLGICRYRATGGAHSFYKRDRVPTIQCHRVYFRPRSNRFPFNLSKVEVRLDQLIRVFCEDLLDFSTTGVSTSCFCSRLAPCLFLSLSLSLSLSPPLPLALSPFFLPSFFPPSHPLTLLLLPSFMLPSREKAKY